MGADQINPLCRLDEKKTPYDLIWEDAEKLSGKVNSSLCDHVVYFVIIWLDNLQDRLLPCAVILSSWISRCEWETNGRLERCSSRSLSLEPPWLDC